MGSDVFRQGGGRQVSEREAKAFVVDILAWLEQTEQQPTQLEQAARGTNTGIITYCLRGGGTNPLFMSQVRQIMQDWPQGWPAKGVDGAMPPFLLAYRQAASARSLRTRKGAFAEQAVGQQFATASQSLADGSAASQDGPPDIRDRAAWEAYWLEREAPGFDGRKHRATPLSRQVA